MIEEKNHPDGTWLTTEYYYKGHKILFKARKGKGFKAHIFAFQDSSKVEKTLRYRFITPKDLQQKTVEYINTLRGQRLILENSTYGRKS